MIKNDKTKKSISIFFLDLNFKKVDLAPTVKKFESNADRDTTIL